MNNKRFTPPWVMFAVVTISLWILAWWPFVLLKIPPFVLSGIALMFAWEGGMFLMKSYLAKKLDEWKLEKERYYLKLCEQFKKECEALLSKSEFGETGQCPKCRQVCWWSGPHYVQTAFSEHLAYRCSKCGYVDYRETQDKSARLEMQP